MANQPPKSPISTRHSDYLRDMSFGDERIRIDSVLAIENLRIGGSPDLTKIALELGVRVASLTSIDRSQRIAHHHRYRSLLAIPEDENVVREEGGSFAEDSLLDIHTRTTEGQIALTDSVWDKNGKGVSVELGHVDQLADWELARPLDEEIRSLPISESLQAAGFEFRNTYEHDADNKLKYRFKLVGNEFSKGVSGSIMAVRKRAVADVYVGDSRYEIIKRSSFLVDALRLDEANLPLLGDIVGVLRKEKDYKPGEREAAMKNAHLAGEAIVEPYLVDKSLRERSQVVLAVSCLYFALKRY